MTSPPSKSILEEAYVFDNPRIAPSTGKKATALGSIFRKPSEECRQAIDSCVFGTFFVSAIKRIKRYSST
jgi:hypothetical protein